MGKRSFLQNILLALAVGTVLFFCLFPFVQILSTSLKHQFDWGNPSLIPIKINLNAYRELLGLGKKEDVANVIDFYIRPESNFITGQIIYLGGIS